MRLKFFVIRHKLTLCFFFLFRFVIDLLDDNRGNRTRSAIDNRHGIVKYEYAVVTTTDSSEPAVGWQEISGLDETVTFKEMLVNGN